MKIIAVMIGGQCNCLFAISQHCSKPFSLYSVNPLNYLLGKYNVGHFTDEKTEAQKGSETHPGSNMSRHGPRARLLPSQGAVQLRRVFPIPDREVVSVLKLARQRF